MSCLWPPAGTLASSPAYVIVTAILAELPVVPQLQVLHQPFVLLLKVALIVAAVLTVNAPAAAGIAPIHTAPESLSVLVFIWIAPTVTRTCRTLKAHGGDPV